MSDITRLSAQLAKVGISSFDAFPNSNPAKNPVDIFRSYISEELSKISGVDRAMIYPALEFTSTPDKGDLLIPVPRLRIKGTPPAELATKWAAEFPKSKYLENVKADGNFLQFTYNPQVLYEVVVRNILKQGTKYGNSEVGKGKKVIVEFSSPNIAKPFHAGHLRSTILGGYISKLHANHGFEVIRMNYLGDWGKQFGLLAVGLKLFGSEKKLQEDPINHLFEVYVKTNKKKEEELAETGSSPTDDEARAYFKRMEAGDEEALSIWRRLRDLSISKYKETYARLNIEFDVYSGESQASESMAQEMLKELKQKDLITEDKGAWLVDLKPYQKRLGKVLVQKSDGTSLYLTRDLAEAVNRYNKYKFDKMIYVIASQQDLHVAQFFKILELMGYKFSKDMQHVNFGMVQGMSTRKGTVVFLDDILNETKNAMHEVMKKNETKYAQVEDPDKVADLVGMAAIMIQDMQSKRINNYEFNWKRMLSFEGDTGPYLQYAHARLCSMERNSGFTREELENADFSLVTEPIAGMLARALAAYPDTLLMSLRNLEPSTVITYLFKLTHIVSSCYDVLWVSGQERELAIARMALYAAARQVLYNGMILLGLTPVERM